MKKSSRNRKLYLDAQGMTLLEILLALLILSTVVTMVSFSLSGSLDILNANRDHGEIYHRAQVALQRITEDLASAVLVEDRDFIGQDDEVNGEEANSLQFTSTAHVVFNQENDNPGLAFISYSIEQDEEEEKDLLLIRSDQLMVTSAEDAPAEDTGEGFILSDRLKAVSFRYFDLEGEELETWTTDKESLESDSDRKLPVAVSCTLEYWLDKVQETSITFTTRVLLPVGLIEAQNDQENSSI